jgi:transposase
MLYAGLDLGSQESFLHVMDRRGKRVSSSRVPMTRTALSKAFEPYIAKGVCVAIEAGGVTRWVHDYLHELGVREVHVANPNKLRLIAESRKKTDKIDAKLLAELYRLDGLPEKVHMPSAPARELRMLIKARNGLVEARTKLLNAARGFLRGQGVRLPPRYLATVSHWEEIMENEVLDDATLLVLASYRDSFLGLKASLKEIEAEIKARAKADERVGNLQSVPGIGIHSSTALVSAVDDIRRFKNGKHLASYCGLVPTVRNSGERQVSGHINRQGRSEVRRTIVQAAHVLANSRSHGARPLQRWFDGVRARRGYKTAIVALARRLVTICFYLLRDGSQYDPTRLRAYA